VLSLDGESFQKQLTVSAFSAFYFEENVSEGEKDITINLISSEKPRMKLLMNESPVKNYDYMMRREKSSSSSLMLDLPNLAFGEEEKSVRAEKDWIYFTFINFEATDVQVQLSIESKFFEFECYIRVEKC